MFSNNHIQVHAFEIINTQAILFYAFQFLFCCINSCEFSKTLFHMANFLLSILLNRLPFFFIIKIFFLHLVTNSPNKDVRL